MKTLILCFMLFTTTAFAKRITYKIIITDSTAQIINGSFSGLFTDTLHKNYKFYYGIGLGIGQATVAGGYGELHAYAQLKSNYIAFKSSSISKSELFGDEPTLSVSDWALIVGKNYSLNRIVNLKFGTGVAVVEQVSRGNFLYNTCKSMFCLLDHDVYETVKTRKIGLPFDVRATIFLDKNLAVTLAFIANINGTKSFSGGSIGVAFGRLRDKSAKR